MDKKFSELAREIIDSKWIGNGADPAIRGISHDTRSVHPGDLFVCIPGYKQDGHSYAHRAVQSGAVALVVQRNLSDVRVPQLVVPDPRKAEAILSSAYYNFPSRKMKLIGITGTNGKTTTSFMIESILESAGYHPAVIGTINYRFAGKKIPALNTTPSSLEVNQLMVEMVESGSDHLIMEVSSHALIQGRVEGIDFDYAIFTNLTRDHLDFHGNMENYLAAKCMLFSKLGTDFEKGFPKRSIINLDDPYSDKIIQSSPVPVLTYGQSDNADIRARNVVIQSGGIDFILVTSKDQTDISLKLTGLFNIYNALASISVCSQLGLSIAQIKAGIEGLSVVPGRFQPINRGQDFRVIIDYAHTDDALMNLLKSVRQITKGKIILVFGAGGDRDRGKRPMMGEVALKYTDKSIITSDNPRTEDPNLIALDIEIGAKRVPQYENRYQIILDREKAIKTAIESALPGDTVVIAGKGHENYQIFADHTIHFDDAEIASKYLDEIAGNREIGTFIN